MDSLNRRLVAVQRAVDRAGISHTGFYREGTHSWSNYDFLEGAILGGVVLDRALPILQRALGVYENDIVPDELRMREEEAQRKREDEESRLQPRITEPDPLPNTAAAAAWAGSRAAARASSGGALDALMKRYETPTAARDELLDGQIAANNVVREAFGYENAARVDAVPGELPPATPVHESARTGEPGVEAAARAGEDEPRLTSSIERTTESSRMATVTAGTSSAQRAVLKGVVAGSGFVLGGIAAGYLQKWGETLRTSNVDAKILVYLGAAVEYAFRWMFWPAVLAGAAYWFGVRKLRLESARTEALLMKLADAVDERHREMRDDIDGIRISTNAPSAAALVEALRRGKKGSGSP